MDLNISGKMFPIFSFDQNRLTSIKMDPGIPVNNPIPVKKNKSSNVKTKF